MEPSRMSRTIAIVEDEPAIRANYVDALTRYGHRVAGTRAMVLRHWKVRKDGVTVTTALTLQRAKEKARALNTKKGELK